MANSELRAANGHTDEEELTEGALAPAEVSEREETEEEDESEPRRGAGDDTSDIQENDSDGEVNGADPESSLFIDSDSSASGAELESPVAVGGWNLHGLASYKQKMLLRFAAVQHLDVLAVCETHLLNSEQLVHWEQTVSLPDSQFCWFGRPAVRAGRSERGRGSGGVGLLIRRDWFHFCTAMPVCDHPCLHFVRLELPDAPFPIYIGVAYAVPIGSEREETNEELLRELGELSAQYQRLGMVLVCGDFNSHIACIPSQLLSRADQNPAPAGSDIGDEEDCVMVLERNSIDIADGDLADDHPGAGVAFMDQLDAAGLVVLNGLCAVGTGAAAEATFGQRSVIDLFLVSAAHWRLMDSVRVQRGACAEVSSDHQLIRSCVRYQPVARIGHRGPVGPAAIDNVLHLINSTRYCTATKGNEQHFAEFEERCREVLPGLVRSWSACFHSDAGLPVEEAWAEFTAEIGTVSSATLGVRRQRSGQKGDSIRRAYGAVREWCCQRKAIWKRINQLLPSERQLRRELEKELHPLNRRIKNHLRAELRTQQQQQVDRVMQLRRRQLKEHWQELKRIGGMQAKALEVPSTVLDASGDEHADVVPVRLQWHDAWAKLAQHREDDPRFDADFHDRIEAGEHIEVEDETIAQAAPLNISITVEEVRESLRQLHRGKAEGSDGISAELLKEGGAGMVQSLHYLCSLMFTAAEVPMDWLRGVVVPLHKDGDRRLPLNYRPITLLSLVGKVYTGVLCERLTGWSERHGVLVPEQGGFRPGRGCPEQVFALTELTKMRARAKLDTYACFIDIKKAYDTVWHAGLKAKLKQYGIHGRMFSALCSLYAGCESTIRLGGALSYTEFFPIETGVRQGCILSPLLYSLFINGVAEELKQNHSEHGVPLAMGPGPRLVLLLYADDIVLLSGSEAGVTQLMAAVHAYSVRWRFEINHSKCGLMCFRWQGSRLPTSEVRLGDRLVAWVPSYKYLGLELHCGVAFKQYRKRALLSAHRAANAVSAMGLYSGKLGVPLGVQVYKAMVRPLLEYCAEVWSVTPWKSAEQLQALMAKRILGVSSHCSNTAVRGELGWMKMDGRWQKARVIFWGKLQCMPNDSPARRVFEASTAEFALSDAADRLNASTPLVQPDDGWSIVYASKQQTDSSLPWCAQVQCDVAQLGAALQEVWRNPALLKGKDGWTLAKWRLEVAKAVRQREKHHWWRCVQERPSLRTYAELKGSAAGLSAEMYLSALHGGWNDLGRVGRRALTRIRCGHHELRCCTGAWDGLDEEDRWCLFCAKAVETERHFLLDCEWRQSERRTLYDAIDAMVTVARAADGDGNAFSVQRLTDAERWRLLTGGTVRSIGKEELQRRVTARILVAIAEWTITHKKMSERMQQARLHV